MMGKYLTSLFICIYLMCMGCQNRETKVDIPKKVIDFGTYHQNEKKEADFVIKNTGKYPLIIKNILPDCHCTLVRASQNEAIPPMATMHIYVSYDNRSTGYFQQTVSFEANTQNDKELLVIRGRVVN